MINLILVVSQIILAFFIISTLYLVSVYYLKNLFPEMESVVEPTASDRQHHLAIVFNDYISEEALVEQIMWLNQQDYKNYSAYFFIDSPFVEENQMKNVRIIRPNHKKMDGFGLLNLAKNYFQNDPEAIMVINPNSKMSEGFLEDMNAYLCKGYRVIQSQIKVADITLGKAKYQTMAKQFYNFIDRKAHQANGLSSALWSQGFLIEAHLFESLNFDTYGNSDKMLQSELLFKSEKIAYTTHASLSHEPNETSEWVQERKNWYQQYIFNYKLGLNLLIEGIKNPNIEKIFFGFNYMRPPLVIMLVASVMLATIDLLWMSKVAFFLWLSFFGICLSLFLLLKPNHFASIFADMKKSFFAVVDVLFNSNRKKTINGSRVDDKTAYLMYETKRVLNKPE